MRERFDFFKIFGVGPAAADFGGITVLGNECARPRQTVSARTQNIGALEERVVIIAVAVNGDGNGKTMIAVQRI